MATSFPMDEIRGLVDERARYEGWLEALEARRGSTAAHVFERVQLDYQARLRRVVETLGEHVPALRDAVQELERGHEELSRQLAAHHDELAEAELRMLVGEFGSEEGERRRQEAAQQIQRLEGEREGITARLEDVREVLGRATPPAEAQAPAAAEAHAPLPELTLAGAEEEPGAAVPLGDAPVPTPAYAAADAHVVGDPDGRSFAADGGSTQHFSPPIRPGAVTPTTGFGERPPAAAPPLRAASPFAPDVGPLVTPAAPFAAQSAPEGGPQQKTLRCEECGEMNFPTEWYCERCGGELAAL